MRLRFVLLGFVVVAVATAVGAGWLLRDPLPHFLARRSTLATVHVGSATTEGAYRLTPAHLTATSGLAVDLMLRRAIADSARRLPLVVILGGHHTGREAARLLDDTRGTVVAAVSYPFDGDPRPDAATFLREIPRIRGAFSTRRRRSCSRWTPAAPPILSLYHAAKAPKEIVWMRGGHVHADTATIRRLAEVVLARVRAPESDTSLHR